MAKTYIWLGPGEIIELAPWGVHREAFVPERTPPRRSPWWVRLLRWARRLVKRS